MVHVVFAHVTALVHSRMSLLSTLTILRERLALHYGPVARPVVALSLPLSPLFYSMSVSNDGKVEQTPDDAGEAYKVLSISVAVA